MLLAPGPVSVPSISATVNLYLSHCGKVAGCGSGLTPARRSLTVSPMAYHTTAEVCKLYGYSRQRLYKLAKRHRLAPAKPPPKNGLTARWSSAQVRKLKPGKGRG